MLINIEQEAYFLAKAYLSEFNKIDVRHFRISNVKKTKYWKAFTKTIEMFGKNPEWDCYKFVEIQFYEFGKIYPFQLATKRAWETYLGYYNRGEVDIEKNIAKSLLSSYQFIRRWELKNGEKFFTHKNTLLFKNISPYYLAISKSFYDIYCLMPEVDKNKLIKEDDLNIKKIMVNIHKKISDKMKEVLGNDYR
jgi:hypothetical protein